MRAFFLLITILSIFHTVLLAQTQTNNTLNCPAFSVVGPTSVPPKNELIPFELNINKIFDSSNIKVRWTISDGEIVSGRENRSIKVKPVTGLETIVTVEVQGLPQGCQKYASSSWVEEALPVPLATKLAEFRKADNRVLNKALNNLISQLKSNPPSTGFIIKSFKRNTDSSKTYLSLQKILKYLETHGIDRARLTFSATKEKTEINEFWILPVGSIPPSVSSGEILDADKLEEKLIKPAKK